MRIHYVSDIHIETRCWWSKIDIDNEEEFYPFLWNLSKQLANSMNEPKYNELVIFLGDTCYDLNVGLPFFSFFLCHWLVRIDNQTSNSELSKIIHSFKSMDRLFYDGHCGKEKILSVCHDLIETLRNIAKQQSHFTVCVLLGDDEYQQYEDMQTCEGEWGALEALGINLLSGSDLEVFLPNTGQWLSMKSYFQLAELQQNAVLLGGSVGFRLYDVKKENGMKQDDKVWMVGKNGEQEKSLGQEWVEQWQQWVDISKRTDLPLLVCTHINIFEWWKKELPEKYLHFHGDDHRNRRTENGLTRIIADGYRDYRDPNAIMHVYEWRLEDTIQIELKQAKEDDRNHSNGVKYQLISLEDYSSKMSLLGLSLPGFSLQKALRTGAKLYLFEYGQYESYVLDFGNVLALCGGAKYRTIQVYTLDGFKRLMPQVVERFSGPLKDFYHYMEQISSQIRLLGGSGRIHGCILDIDFYNHVAISPADGTMQWYHSSEYLSLEQHDNILSLASKRANWLLENIQNLSNKNNQSIEDGSEHYLLSPINSLKMVGNKLAEYVHESFTEETKESFSDTIYPLSNKMVSMQRLHYSKLLTFWPDDIKEYLVGNAGKRYECHSVDLCASTSGNRANILVWGDLQLDSCMKNLHYGGNVDDFLKDVVNHGVDDFLRDALKRNEQWVLILSNITQNLDTLESFLYLLVKKLSYWDISCKQVLVQLQKFYDLKERMNNCLQLYHDRSGQEWKAETVEAGQGRLHGRILTLQKELESCKRHECIVQNLLYVEEDGLNPILPLFGIRTLDELQCVSVDRNSVKLSEDGQLCVSDDPLKKMLKNGFDQYRMFCPLNLSNADVIGVPLRTSIPFNV